MWGLADVDEDEEPSGQAYYWMAVIHGLLNNTDAAVTKLRMACSKEPKLLKRVAQDPMLASLAQDERVAQLMTATSSPEPAAEDVVG